MSNYRRDQTPGGTWFFTVVAFKRRPLFCQQTFLDSLRRSVRKTRKSYPFKIEAWILLPDHLHCVWTLPDGDANFSIRWKLIKQYVTKDFRSDYREQSGLSAAKKKRRESSIWQRRFWEHKIRSERDFTNHLDYLHFNPVKHGHCHSASQWPYSSFHRYRATGVYPKGWAATEVSRSGETSNFGEP